MQRCNGYASARARASQKYTKDETWEPRTVALAGRGDDHRCEEGGRQEAGRRAATREAGAIGGKESPHSQYHVECEGCVARHTGVLPSGTANARASREPRCVSSVNGAVSETIVDQYTPSTATRRTVLTGSRRKRGHEGRQTAPSHISKRTPRPPEARTVLTDRRRRQTGARLCRRDVCEATTMRRRRRPLRSRGSSACKSVGRRSRRRGLR